MIAALLLAAGLPISDWQPLFEPLPERAAGWRQESGVLRTVPGHFLQTGDLYTRLRYRDFEFQAEYRVAPGANSGIRYLPLPGRTAGLTTFATLCGVAGSVAIVLLRRRRRLALLAVVICLALFAGGWRALSRHPLALEFQVLDNTVHPDGGKGALYRAGAMYGIEAAGEDASRPSGEWNEARVVVCGNKVEHWLNGRKVVDVDLTSPEHTAARAHFYQQSWYRLFRQSEWSRLALERPSTIGLQHHGEEVWYRGVKIRELSCE